MSDGLGFLSYRSPRTVVAESVRGEKCRQAHEIYVELPLTTMVTPFPAPGSVAAAKEVATGIFKPVPPFYSLTAIPSNALFFGSILGYQRLCAKSLELVRRKEDVVNDIFGFAMIWPYYHYFLNHSHQRLVSHNRVVGGMLVASVVYANFLA
eukprot:scaffold5538_cov159-Amphora_coffeaeformis.AAC.11